MENKKLTHPDRRRVGIIVAMSPNHAIGYKGALPWHVPEDLAHFKEITWGHTVIMGRKTFDSLPHGALPSRRNIVLSRTSDEIEGCLVCHSLAEALSLCDDGEEIFVIGGESVYRQALPLAGKLYITLVDGNPQFADTFFPTISNEEWKETKKEKHVGFSFIELLRI